jgi:erythromycin esterase-like protein
VPQALPVPVAGAAAAAATAGVVSTGSDLFATEGVSTGSVSIGSSAGGGSSTEAENALTQQVPVLRHHHGTDRQVADDTRDAAAEELVDDRLLPRVVVLCSSLWRTTSEYRR